MLFDQEALGHLLRAAKLPAHVDLLIGAKVCVSIQPNPDLPEALNFIVTTISAVCFSTEPDYTTNQPINSDQVMFKYLRISLAGDHLGSRWIVKNVWLSNRHNWYADLVDQGPNLGGHSLRTVCAKLEIIG